MYYFLFLHYLFITFMPPLHILAHHDLKWKVAMTGRQRHAYPPHKEDTHEGMNGPLAGIDHKAEILLKLNGKKRGVMAQMSYCCCYSCQSGEKKNVWPAAF